MIIKLNPIGFFRRNCVYVIDRTTGVENYKRIFAKTSIDIKYPIPYLILIQDLNRWKIKNCFRN